MFSLDGYKAALAGGAVVRRTDRGVLTVSGADRGTWLQGLLTNDVQSLRSGQTCYSAYLTPQGRMITDMHVFAQAERLLLDVPASLAPGLRERLDSLIFAEDARVADESATLSVWTVIAADALVAVIGEELPAGFAALPAIDLDTFEVIRLERGVPRFTVDMTEDTIPLEAGIEDRAISFTKGCYVGQEVIVRVTTRGGGRVARKLVGWTAEGSTAAVPAPGSTLFVRDTEIGRVTSAAFSPNLKGVVGLGYVRRDYTDSDTELTILWNDARIKAVVR